MVCCGIFWSGQIGNLGREYISSNRKKGKEIIFRAVTGFSSSGVPTWAVYKPTMICIIVCLYSSKSITSEPQ